MNQTTIPTINKKAYRCISDALHKLGIPCSLRGYRYIVHSVLMSLCDSSALDGVTTVLYPSAAKRYDTTTSRVERAIRHAVAISMERGDTGFINHVFGYTVSNTKGKPTNGEFISMLTEYVYINIM